VGSFTRLRRVNLPAGRQSRLRRAGAEVLGMTLKNSGGEILLEFRRRIIYFPKDLVYNNYYRYNDYIIR